ncbi:MAG: hypothetical protein AABX29_08155 [Nanoarchaeota archaeon]
MDALEAIAGRQLNEIPVSELNLGVRGEKRLKQLGVEYISDLQRYDAESVNGGGFGTLSLQRLNDELSKYGVSLKTRMQRRHERICDAIIKAKQGCVESQTRLAEVVGETLDIIRYHAKKANITLPNGRRGVKPGTIPERIIDIIDGLTPSEAGRKWGISTQGAASYISHPDRYNIWENAHAERLERLEELKELEKIEAKKEEDEKYKRILDTYKTAKANGDWAFQRAMECMLIHKRTRMSFETILGLFENLEIILNEDERVNYLKLSNRTGIGLNGVREIMKKMMPWLEENGILEDY